MDLNLSGQEYRNLLNNWNLSQFKEPLKSNDVIETCLKLGERNLDWLKHINSFLSSEKKISISKKETQQGFPVETPRVYSPTIIEAQHKDLLAELPQVMLDVLVNGKSFTDTPPLEVSVYADWALRVDRLYQIAARWTLMVPHLNYYKARKAGDIRGYYFSQREADFESKLQDFSHLTKEEQTKYSSWLLMICANNGRSKRQCSNELTRVFQSPRWIAIIENICLNPKLSLTVFSLQNPWRKSNGP